MKKLNKTLSFLLLNMITISAFAGNPTKAGDIVGRDLAVPEWASWTGVQRAGHIGIWNGNQVVEVLDKQPVIQFNSLQSFKQQAPYWGARGNKTFLNSNQIDDIAKEQLKFAPEYTKYSPMTRIGRTKRECTRRRLGMCRSYQTVIINAKFRCDTFVDYVYRATSNNSLVEWATILPVLAYNRVEVTR